MPSAAPSGRAPRRQDLVRAALALIVASLGAACRADDDAVDADDPRTAGRFVGRVVDVAENPVAGARLHVVPAAATEGPGPVRAVTGPDGRFAFDAPDLTFTARDGLPARQPGLLIAAADGFAPDAVPTWGRVEARNNGLNLGGGGGTESSPGAEIVARLPRDDVSIRGRLLDAEGRPLAGARVRVENITTPAGYDVIAYLEGLITNRGEAQDRFLGKVELLPGVDRLATVDADGRFRLAGLGRDRLAGLIVGAPGLGPRKFTVALAAIPEVVLARDAGGLITWGVMPADFSIRLKLDATTAIRGVVRDRGTHRPVAGMRVYTSINTITVDDPRLAVTDDEGRFEVTGLAPSVLEPMAPPEPGPLGAKWQPWKVSAYAVATPGVPYLRGIAAVDRADGLIIESTRAIPYRLRIVDEAGAPVDIAATVGSCALAPNDPNAAGLIPAAMGVEFPLGRAARRGPGVYEGFVVPGPGAVLVDVPDEAGFGAAQVDPKGFFAPGRADWTVQERTRLYGTRETLATFGGGPVAQSLYEAIVLVNPPADSPPLELTARLRRDRPITVHLVDPEGNPVVGVQAVGLTQAPLRPNIYESALPLRSATFPLRRLPPDLTRRVYLHHEDRKLIGFLPAHAAMAGPVTVRMRRWATLRGRFLDGDGRPLNIAPQEFGAPYLTSEPLSESGPVVDPALGWLPIWHPNRQDGRFLVDRLVPGQRYILHARRVHGNDANRVVDVGLAFDGTLEPGEDRDLGDIRTRKLDPAAGR